jgi:hypothetical protein
MEREILFKKSVELVSLVNLLKNQGFYIPKLLSNAEQIKG